MKDFVNLHTHTTYSLMNSLIEPNQLFKKVKELGQLAVAVTDMATLAGAWDCLKYSKEAGVKLIMGCEFYFLDDLAAPNADQTRLRHLILLAKNHQGYKNLLLAGKLANENNIIAFKKAIPRIDWKILEQVKEGLICTTACGSGILGQLINTRRLEEAKIQAKRLQEIFGENLALEVQPHNMTRDANAYHDYENQMLVNRAVVKMGQELGIKVIATCDAHYLTSDQHETHDVMCAISAGQALKSNNRPKYDNEFYLRTREQMEAFFNRWPTLFNSQELCDNTLYFAEQCEPPEWIDPKVTRPAGVLWDLPTFPVKDRYDYEEFKQWKINYPELKEDEGYLQYWCENGFNTRLSHLTEEQKTEYRQRLKDELEVLFYKGLSSYMLLVADFLQWARNQGIAIGPGRGSISGSLCGYLIEIHDADPIKYGLIFERFYNKNKTGSSDVDSDVSKCGKPLVEEYLTQKYGKENCVKITNYMALTPKPYVKAIAKTFLYGGDHKAAIAVGNAIADNIPKEIHTIKSALEEVPLLEEYANSEKYHHIKKYAEIGNKYVARSTHAAGVIICSRPVHEIVPIRRDKDNVASIEYDKDEGEENGLIKFDVLGLSTLDIIGSTLKLIKERNKPLPKIPWDYDENNKKAYDLICAGNTFGIFQFGTSGGTIDLCKRLQPRNILDLAAINALTRPGVTKEFREEYIEAKNGLKEVKLLHPSLERSFKATYGIGIYDECLMTLGQDVAGWTLAETDQLRKFVKEKGKNPEKEKKIRANFIKGAVENKKIPLEMATRIWDEVVGNFGKYAFNKSHAVTYSFIAYQTAYLKANYPLEFLVANLAFESNSNALDSEDNVLRAKNEIRALGVKIIPPDINKSEMTYKIIDDNTVMTGLDSLKFIGKKAIPEILKKRPFTSFEDFLSKVDGREVPAPSILAMIASGALDSFGMPRKMLYLHAADYKKKIALWLKKQKEKPTLIKENFPYPWPEEQEEWTIPEKFAMEKNYLGEGLSGSLKEIYPNFFDNKAIDFSKLEKMYPKSEKKEKDQFIKGTIQAVIKECFEFRVKKEDSKIYGEVMGKILLEDPYGNKISMTLFPDKMKHMQLRLKELGGKVKIEPGTAIHCSGYINWYGESLGIVFEDLKRVAPSPALPADLKPRKVSMKLRNSRKKTQEPDPDLILEEVEEELIEEGLSELEMELLEERKSFEEEEID